MATVGPSLTEKVLEIVGGGVAGLSLGVGLRKAGVRVVLQEAGTYPRHRLCGEFVHGVTPSTLARLGVEDLFAAAQHHRRMTWWLRDEKLADAALRRAVPALSRWEMDQWLRERFESAGGDLRCGQRVACEAKEGRIWTAGRRRNRDSEWLGLKAHFHDLETCSGLEMHLGEGCYLGLTPVEKQRVNVCGLFRLRRDLSGKGGERLFAYLNACGLTALEERLRAATIDEASVTGVSGIAFGDQHQEGALLALGDAGRMIPPFTGNGMSMAFESAECALDPVISYARGEQSWEATHREVQGRLQKRFRQRMAIAKGLHSFLFKSSQQGMLAALARSGLLPISLLTRLLT